MGHAAPERLGRHVDELDLVGAAHHGVGHRLALGDAGDPRDDVVERLEVLDVDRGDHVDAGVEQLARRPATASRCALPGALVWANSSTSDDLGPPGQHGVDVDLLSDGAAVLDVAARHHLEVAELRRGVRPAVGLDDADHDVGAAVAPAARPR